MTDRFARGLAETFHVSLRSITENFHTFNSVHIALAKANHMTKLNISELRKYILDMENPWQKQERENYKQIIQFIISAYYCKEKKVSTTSTTPI